MPTLLKRTSTPPKASTVRRTTSRQMASWETSPSTKMALPPESRPAVVHSSTASLAGEGDSGGAAHAVGAAGDDDCFVGEGGHGGACLLLGSAGRARTCPLPVRGSARDEPLPYGERVRCHANWTSPSGVTWRTRPLGVKR